MIVGRKLKRNIFIDTDIDCQNCGSWQRVCTWNGECDNLEPMTNEEWLKSLNTEDFAKAITNIEKLAKIEQIEWWLKQPHTPKE